MQVGCPHRPRGFHPPLTAGKKLITLMWLAHGCTASPPGGRSSWLLRNMLAASECVCFVGRLTECQGSWGAAVWMTGQQGSAGGLPAQAKRSTFPSTMGCSFGFSPSLPSVHTYPTCCLIWESTQSGVKQLGNGRFYSPKLKSEWYLQLQKFSNFF